MTAADQKPVDAHVDAIPTNRWDTYCEVAQWALADDTLSRNDAGLKVLDMFVRHVAFADDDASARVLLNAITQPVDGFSTSMVRNIPDATARLITNKTKQVGLPTLLDFASVIIEDARDGVIKARSEPVVPQAGVTDGEA